MAETPQHRGTQPTRKSKTFVRNKVQENSEKNKAINHSKSGEWGREGERKRENGKRNLIACAASPGSPSAHWQED